jgi:hypothetical protein
MMARKKKKETPMSDTYWAALPPEEFAPVAFDKINDFYEYLRTSNRLKLYQNSYDYFYQAYRSGGETYKTGPQGEYTNIDLADYRNILLHLKVMTINNRPAYEPKATNSDHKSATQTILADGLLEYYLRQKKLERYNVQAVEYALMYGEGYVGLDWNATAGDSIATDPDTGEEKYQGDLEAWSYSPMEVPIDVTRTHAEGHDWKCVRRIENKWNVLAKYAPDEKEHADLRERIKSQSLDDTDREFMFGLPKYEDTDMIAVYTFYHRRSEALPKGRMTRLISDDTILTDGDLPFKEIPLYRMAPGEQDGTPFGYTVGFDLLPLQQAINSLLSTIATNHATFGVQNIMAPKGHGMSVAEILDGLNLLEYDGNVGKPEALNLVETPAEVFKFIETLRSMMEMVAGINSVSRGDPQASLKSGAALALVQSMAIQFNSGLQLSYSQLSEDVGTGIIKVLQDFATTTRIASISGKSKRSMVKEWTGEDLDQVTRVTVDLGNPLSQTVAGRVSMADSLLERDMIENPDQYLQVIATGRLDPAIEGKQAEILNIKSENEHLAEGDIPDAVVTDMHVLHIQEHKVVLSSPEARAVPEVVEAVTAHMQQHIELLKSDPVLLKLLGQEPLQAPPPPPPGGNGGPPAMGPPDVTGNAGLPVSELGAALTNPADVGAAAGTNLPAQPENPLSGEQFNPQSGGLPNA